jgi:putative CRISPR-associated protein (TIGR02620 family)
MNSKKIVVTRHTALIDYLLEIGLIATDDYTVINHATEKDIQGKDVIGVLPIGMASLVNSITEIPLSLTAEMRGKELSLEDLREIAGTPATYKVSKIS